MLTFQQQQFLAEFFNFLNPEPMTTSFTQEQFRSNDMKISLQIATKSNLRMQSDPKTGIVTFSCKNYGKACYQIFGFRKNGLYIIQSDYTKMRHGKCCELHHETFQYLKIYNLMKLKKDLIENYMIRNLLINASPSQILSSISQQNQYFFQKHINYNSELRRKLRKRFDNIINIDIKKITKGGRDDMEFIQRDISQVLKERKNCQQFQIRGDKQSCNKQKQKFKKQRPKQKLIKKTSKGKKKQTPPKTITQNQSVQQNEQKQNNYFIQQNHQIEHPQNHESSIFSNNYFTSIDDPIYISSESQLPQIKELNEGCNYFGDVFSWSEEQKGVVQMETINDKLRETVLMGMRKNNKY